MRKKLIIIVIFSLVVLGFLFTKYLFNTYEEKSVSDIKTNFELDPIEYMSVAKISDLNILIVDKEDIERIVQSMKDMKLRRKKDEYLGFDLQYIIQISTKSEAYSISLDADKKIIIFNGPKESDKANYKVENS